MSSSFPFPSPSLSSNEPQRLVFVQIKCFYCGHAVEDDIRCYRICHLFGIYYCPAHSLNAERDCQNYMDSNGIIRLCDARNNPTLGLFMNDLGNTIPVLRSSGDVERNWKLLTFDELPIIRRSKTTGLWGFHLTNGIHDKFVPFAQFRDPKIHPFIKTETLNLLEPVETLLTNGFYRRT